MPNMATMAVAMMNSAFPTNRNAKSRRDLAGLGAGKNAKPMPAPKTAQMKQTTNSGWTAVCKIAPTPSSSGAGFSCNGWCIGFPFLFLVGNKKPPEGGLGED